MQCRIDGCNALVQARSYCWKHYQNLRRHGTPEAPKRVPVTHCKHGHEFTAANTYHRYGRRYCKRCLRNRNNAYRQRDRDEDRAWFAQHAGSSAD